MHEIRKIDRKAYELAKAYLPSLNIPKITISLVEKYLDPLSLDPKPVTKNQLYHRILESAQNANMKAGVIGKAVNGIDKLSPVLFDFDPREVLCHYDNDWEAVLDQIVTQLKPRGQIRRTSRSIWPKYCQIILDRSGRHSIIDTLLQIITFENFSWRAK